MKKFLVLYFSSVSAAEQMSKATPEQAKAGMDAWMAWAKEAGPAIVDLGSPVGHAKKVASGATTKSEIKAGGFSILQADSIEKVSALLLKHPHHHAPGASIEVLEFIPIPGM
jgi:hypothetical protein